MSIIKKEAYFYSSTGVNKIRTLIWHDDDVEPVAVIQIAHGVCEHIDRYDDFARFLASKGYVVCGNDHIGHGKSVESMEDLGFTAEKEGYRRFVDDMHILYSIMHHKYPELPYFLFGHSMGSLCARVYATKFGDELKGLILCGTLDIPASAVVLEEPLKYLCEKLGPETKVSNSLFDKLNTLGIKDKKTDKDWLSANEENVQAFILDPLCGNDLKLGGIRDLVSLANSACCTTWALRVPYGLPILIISGAKDPVGFNGKGVISVSDSLEEAGLEPKVIMYPGFRHEILNEDNREAVFEDVYSWTKEVLNSEYIF